MFGWGKKKQKENSATQELPSADREPARYEGAPLLILLENWILKSIGEFAPEKEQSIRTVVQQVYGGGDDWGETLRASLDLGENIEDSFRAMWKRNQEIAAENNTTLHPVQFVKMLVDQNFMHLVDGGGA
jgi:hypothetical protein